MSGQVAVLYTVVMEYEGTGEGFTKRVLLVGAYSEHEARERFRQVFFPQSQAWAFFARGVDVHAGVHRPSLTLLDAGFLDRLEMHPRPHAELYLSWTFNLS